MLYKRRRSQNNIRARDRGRRNNWFRMRLQDGPRLGTQLDLFSPSALTGRYEPDAKESERVDWGLDDPFLSE
jgi:hypothetical protein